MIFIYIMCAIILQFMIKYVKKNKNYTINLQFQ